MGKRPVTVDSRSITPWNIKLYRDLMLKNDAWILKKIVDEKISQLNKWGIQNRTAFEWLTYTAEELGELAEAISEHQYRGGPKERVVKEAIQLATLALTIGEIFDAPE